AWCGAAALWVRSERARTDRALAEFDFDEARRHLARCVELRPRDPDLRLLAARTARRAGDLAAARQELDAYRAAAKESTPQFNLERQLLAVQQGRTQGNVEELIEALDIRHPQGEFILEA